MEDNNNINNFQPPQNQQEYVEKDVDAKTNIVNNYDNDYNNDNNNLSANTYSDQPAQGMAIASLVLGIVSLIIPCFGFITSILAIIFGVSAKSSGNNEGITTVGIVLGIVSISLYIICILIYTFAVILGIMSY